MSEITEEKLQILMEAHEKHDSLLIGDFQFAEVAEVAIPKLVAEIRRQRAENAELRTSLLGVVPSHRKPDLCWCGINRDLLTYGHSAVCQLARKALEVQP